MQKYFALFDGVLMEGIDLPLNADYQSYNLRTALSALWLIKKEWQLKEANILSGISKMVENTGFSGRWQIVGEDPRIILDTGHNVAGLTLTMNQLKSEKFEKLHFVLGMVNDKDIDSVLKLLPKFAEYYFCKADIPRGMDAQELSDKAGKLSLLGNVYSSVKEAYAAAKNNAKAKDLIFVGGSTFVVAEVV